MGRVRVAVVCVVFCTVLVLSKYFDGELPLSNPLKHSWSNIYSPKLNDFSWATLPASAKLEWRNCQLGRQCARLEVPLNYSDPHGPKATIALVRKPALVPVRSGLYRGPVLFNPGGPGGSGVSMISGGAADLFSTILGPEYDIVGFDPRGVGHSTPRASFFKTDVERALWGGGITVANNSDDGIGRTWARNKVMGQLAGEQDDGYLRHINTDQTARDMLKIVEAHGREKILYWGFSYGSVLGATFAAMFPDKIERLIIDGVVDSENYYATLWSNNLRDTDKSLQAFLNGCVDAGPIICPFYAPTPAAIRQNLTNLYETVRSNPLPIKSKKSYGVLDYSAVRSFVLGLLYSPYALFPIGAKALAELAAGDGTMMFELLNPPEEKYACSCDGSLSDSVVESQATILCNDGDDVPGDLESSKKYFDMMARKSEWGDIWSSIRLGCVGWPKFPKNHFQGPFVANTSHPILLIGNTADPVTPLWAAKKMSQGFKGSVVLTQDSPGHCSVSAPSLCTQKYVREYFALGTLPNPGTVCEPLLKPFPGSARVKHQDFDAEDRDQAAFDSDLEITMTADERDIWGAIKELSQIQLIPRLL